MARESISSPENQSATFVELFFDLVFVFSVTQVVGLLHEGITWESVGQGVLVFWLVWWAWSQFTWSLNAADTTHSLVQLGILAATAVAFFMAVALPEAFHDRAVWFAITYVVVRVIGLAIFYWVARDPAHRAAVRTFALFSIGGLAAVLVGGALGGSLQYLLWGSAILLDIVAAAIGGKIEGWDIRPEHFAERHGLFVIIAFGESLIVAGSGVMDEVWTGELIATAALVVVITCCLWWSYFQRAKPQLDHALESSTGSVQSRMARDAFTLAHFTMIGGIVAYAVAVEEALAHPGDPLPIEGRIALAVGLALFVGGTAIAYWRAVGRVLFPRLLVVLSAAVLIAVLAGASSLVSLVIALAGVLIVVAWEQWAESPIAETTTGESRT